MPVKIPFNLTNNDKLKYLYRAVELLRLEHNETGKKYRDGILNSWDWQNYVRDSFEPRNQRLFAEINEIKEAEDMTRTGGQDEKGLYLNPKIQIANQLMEEGKKEIKWDKDIKLQEI